MDSVDSNPDGLERVCASWLKVGVVSAISALAGGIAAAWIYRKTLNEMHSAAHEDADTKFHTEAHPADEI